ncbi:MAG TPA: hypothetical protein VIT43_12835 [Candidatus Dormibacteraeota bacterium]
MGSESDLVLRDASANEALPTRLVWEAIYGRALTDAELAEIEGNLFRFIDLLARINGSILGAPDLSTCDGDEAA